MHLPPQVQRQGQYCVVCHAPDVQRIVQDGRTYYVCASCTIRSERSIVVDDAVTWWVDAEGVYWHESAGVILFNERGEILMVSRAIFPFAHAIPAGHVDTGEDPLSAVQRELREEIGIDAPKERFLHVATFDMRGDQCRRGCDDHRWHLYAMRIHSSTTPRLNDEAHSWQWMTREAALRSDLVFALRYILTTYEKEIDALRF